MKIKCKKCLLVDMNMQEAYENVREYISQIPSDIKTDDKEYSRRLEICKSCDNLAEGTCLKCGCYVEIRAAKKNAVCPDEKNKWE